MDLTHHSLTFLAFQVVLMFQNSILPFQMEGCSRTPCSRSRWRAAGTRGQRRSGWSWVYTYRLLLMLWIDWCSRTTHFTLWRWCVTNCSVPQLWHLWPPPKRVFCRCRFVCAQNNLKTDLDGIFRKCETEQGKMIPCLLRSRSPPLWKMGFLWITAEFIFVLLWIQLRMVCFHDQGI